MTKSRPRVAVLGAGIMGCATALFLARRGAEVTLFDAADRPFTAASRWNEGKIHLGYIYSADPTLRTADHVIPGGLAFRPLVEELLEQSITPVTTEADDVYLCHRTSVVSPEDMAAYMGRVAERVRAHPDATRYLADVSQARARRLDEAELRALSGSTDIVTGFRVPERSVEPAWIGNKFVAAVAAETRIESRMDTRILSARSLTGSADGAWEVETTLGTFGPYDHVVNALWQGRMAIDETAGLKPVGVWSNRYRQALFLRTTEPVEAPCVVIATGPFGDIKNYNGRDFYLSWYPDGLRIDTDALSPDLERWDEPDPEIFTRSVLDRLQSLLPWVAHIRERTESVKVGGGWVFAAGRGLLSDPSSTLHKRSDYGVTRLGGYLSVDTGKFSTAPWQAKLLADSLF